MQRRDKLVTALAALPGGTALDRVCRLGVELLGVDGSAVILMSDEEAGSVAAAYGPAVRVVEDLQFSLGEGPCLTAFRSGCAVLEPDIGPAAATWPVFAPAAAAAGVRAVFALPLQIGAIRLGVLYLVRSGSGPLRDEALADAHGLAQIATMTLLDQRQDGEPVLDGYAAAVSWAHRAVVHQATGMVAAQLDVKLADALARLRANAFAAERSLYDVAVDVVERRLRLAQNDNDGGAP